ncbi:MAG: pantetheine-phosphate adenylyltransferase [Clostridia bacterium]|nr:pantetheine-phosphate adenylyltransferase [Clostridia bacterium]
MSRAIIPGSFDPMTLGHLQVVKAAAEIFDEVIVLVMNNDMTKYVKDAKVKEYLFDTGARVEIARLTCADLPGVRVETRGGLLIDAFDELCADVIVKGVRNEADFAYEQVHAAWNLAHNPRAKTVYLPSDPAYAHLSSTLAREKLKNGESLEGVLAESVIAWLQHSAKGE